MKSLCVNRGKWRCVLVSIAAACVVAGCATGAAFRHGQEAARSGDWDRAVEHYRMAVQEEPRNAAYRAALQRAMLNASRVHLSRARALEADGALADAVREYRIASGFDPSNSYAAGRALELERNIRDRLEASRPQSPIERMQDVARRETEPPLLDPTSGEPLSLRFVDQSLQDILDFLGNATGINISYDQQFQDRVYTVELDGVTLEQALDQILIANQHFYKVLSPRSLIVVPETPQKRVQYEEQIIRTFYISNADVQELATVLNQVIRGGSPVGVQPTIVPNVTANTIAVRATPAVMGVIEQVIAANDKPRAEIIVDIEILEVNRERAREFGLDLAQYSVSSVYAPDTAAVAAGGNLFATPPPVAAGNFFFSIPSVAIDFLESDDETRVVAKPQLRGQEGATLTLNLGDDIPVPTTAFTPIAAGGATVNPLTSFDYRPIGVIVEMTPRVTYSNEIILDLEVENSTLGPSVNVAGQPLPTFGTRRVITRLRLRDGESNLLAGLLREVDRRSLRGFPGIAHLPVIRQLLSANEDTIRQTDIIMLLTPRIVRTHELTQEDVSPVRIDTQPALGAGGRLRPRVDTPAAVQDDAAMVTPSAAGAVGKPPGPPRIADTAAADVFAVGPRIGLDLPDHGFQMGGGPYTVPISVDGASQVSTLALSLQYDPSVLRVSAVQEGDFMRQNGVDVMFARAVDGRGGRVDLTLSRAGDSMGASGSGLLAAVVVEPLRPGQVTLTPSGVGLTPGGAPLVLGFDPATVMVR